MRLVLSFQAVLCACLISAQPVLTANELLPPLGPQAVQDFGPYVPASPAVADFVFDVSGYQGTWATRLQYLVPEDTPFISYFPQATHCYTDLDFPNVYVYFDAGQDEVVYLGLRSGAGYVITDDPIKRYELPMVHGQTFTDTWTANGQSSQGILFTETGTTTVVYNGYGTVILPTGTYTNCARIETNEEYVDLYENESVGYYRRNMVSYFKPGLSDPIFASMVYLGVINVEYDTLETKSFALNDLTLGVHHLEAPGIIARVYPNPASQSVFVQLIEVPNTLLTASLLDATGRIIREFPVFNSVSGQEQSLDVSGLEAGAYYVRLCDGAGRVGTFPLVVE